LDRFEQIWLALGEIWVKLKRSLGKSWAKSFDQ